MGAESSRASTSTRLARLVADYVTPQFLEHRWREDWSSKQSRLPFRGFCELQEAHLQDQDFAGHTDDTESNGSEKARLLLSFVARMIAPPLTEKVQLFALEAIARGLDTGAELLLKVSEAEAQGALRGDESAESQLSHLWGISKECGINPEHLAALLNSFSALSSSFHFEVITGEALKHHVIRRTIISPQVVQTCRCLLSEAARSDAVALAAVKAAETGAISWSAEDSAEEQGSCHLRDQGSVQGPEGSAGSAHVHEAGWYQKKEFPETAD